MSIKDLPSKLYKYKGVSDGVLDGLSKGKVWFSHLDKLNDPYENEYDYDDSIFFSNLNNYLETIPAEGLPTEICQIINELKWQKKDDAAIIQYLEQISIDGGLKTQLNKLKGILKEHKSCKAGILSLCANFDNLLMWAYYADNYAGICMEFSTEENAEILNNEKFTFKVDYNNRHYNMKDVFPFYSSKYPNKSLDDFEMGICLPKIYAHKSTAWSHEREWRVISDISKQKESSDKGGALMPFPGKLTAIYFGDRATTDAINSVKDAVVKGSYGYEPLYKRAKLKKDSFGIELINI